MEANLFFQTSQGNSLPLIFIRQTQWEEGLEQFNEREQKAFALQQFKAKLGDVCIVTEADGSASKAYVGTGKQNAEQAIAYAATRLIPGSYIAQEHLTPTALTNWALAQYRFGKYKKQDINPRRLVVREEQLADVSIDIEAVFLVRNLINLPTNDLGPEELALVLEDLAEQHNGQFQQWVGKELLQHNFPAIYAVGCASAKSPRLLSLTWGNENNPKVSIIGKGVCFDSGGLDIKPAQGMRLMKKDMGGAAHAIALAKWIMKKNLNLRLQVLIPAVENAIGPEAFRPGDILTMRNGLTVEVDNTDAEGRLILADAIVKACEEKPDLLIDFATLTGSARAAVGTEIAALFCNDDALAQAIMDSAKYCDDPIWRLPLFSGYESMLESSVADLVNCSASPYAGAITAALFLQRFLNAPLGWLHFDIMAWNLSSKPGKPEGGEAMGLRAVAHYLAGKYGSQ
ncbi:leucyl aminopeptidase family protein [Legionella jordanis]|uniref:Aminopeptidase n=1 Tax=Legionella jordanis TaxID=456 RepID=A0A0W0V9R7_9GAMM|nr:leucyl aminopeptidase family protein [Legionella jordanis]KTD16621.1 aminopeptidase [Legionella jordanis]RMX03842.1 leucyl aminopeptidase family protein [Legionella jordanis]VEH11915.1 aminopeptidase [Legionella jordanis]HAT8712781.1 leucyl aminopeptidase family protein [Legionella jordanis]